MDIRAELALIPGPRIDRCKKHKLVDMLLLCIIAMVFGVESVEDIVFFGETHEQWLRKHLALPHGIPSADTILRGLGRIGHRKFEGCFLSWTRGHFRERASPGAGAGGDCPLFIFPLLRLLIYPLLYPTIHVGIQR